MKIGHIIKEIRKSNRLTQADFAKKLGVAPTAVSAWERDENLPLMDKLVMISEMFSVPITDFFSINTEPQTIAAHHDAEDWSEEELVEIERFKAFVKSKRTQE